MQVKRATAKKHSRCKNKMSSRNITGGNFLNKRNIILALIAVLVLAILALLKNQFIVVSVNGESINRLTLIRELEKQAGKKFLRVSNQYAYAARSKKEILQLLIMNLMQKLKILMKTLRNAVRVLIKFLLFRALQLIKLKIR